MTEPRAQRTLVKSPPELWTEISNPEALTRHLGEFGAIRITHLEPESTVAWEGDRVRGTVELEAAGWGTRVTLTAEAPGEPVAPVVEEVAPPVAAPARASAPLPPARRLPGLLARLLRRPRAAGAEPAPEPVPLPVRPTPPPAPATDPPPAAAAHVEAVLVGVLDELGSASKRPFAR